MANQIARIRDLQRTRQEHEMSRHSAERNHGHIEFEDYDSNYEGYGGIQSYNVHRAHYDMGAIGHHYQQVERMRHFGLSGPPAVSFQRNPAGRSSVHAINLCDDESDFCVVSPSISDLRSDGRSQSSSTHASTSISASSDLIGSSSGANFNFAFRRDSASAYSNPLDLTGDTGTGTGTGSDRGSGSGMGTTRNHTAIDLTSVDDVIDLRNDDSAGLGDLWAVSGAGAGAVTGIWPSSSSSSSLSEAPSSSSSSSSSSTSDFSFPEPIFVSPPTQPCAENSSSSSSSTVPNIIT